MRRALFLVLLALPLLAGCRIAGAEGGAGALPPVADEEITVTALDPAVTSAAAEAAVPAEPVAPGPRMAAETVVPAAGEMPAVAEAPPDAEPEAATEAESVASDAVIPEAAPEVPEELKSPAQIACEKKGGRISRVGGGDSFICVFRTRDGGKRCKKEGDCEGLCLARSGTCAPVRPLLGCQEILQQDGFRVTQCID